MAYVAMKGGTEAIEASIKLLELYRSGCEKELDIEVIENKMRLLVDRVMAEAGLYSKTYAAIALRQAEGSIDEAVFLLRAYRSTLTRHYYIEEVDCRQMRVVRRISAAFKDIVGGQMLGATYDYTHRLIDFSLDEKKPNVHSNTLLNEQINEVLTKPEIYPRVSDLLKEEGLIDEYQPNHQAPFDVTKNILEFPADRSARLQTLARADTGFVSGLAYSSLRGFGQIHPTVGELRCGYIELHVTYLLDSNESLFIGEILVTEVECFNTVDDKQLKLAVGYGAVFGWNENKAISIAVIDRELDNGGIHPVHDEEFVLTHGDSLEMNGFISHLKLPHYVTFQSKLDTVRKTRETT